MTGISEDRCARCAQVLALLALLGVSPARGAAGPGALPEAYWWRRSLSLSLATDPLQALAVPEGIASAIEWAPIYDGPHASRVRQTLATMRVVAQAGAWRYGAEVEQGSALGAGGEAEWNARLAVPSATTGALGVERTGRRSAYAAAASFWDGHVGGAFSARVRAAPGVEGAVSWSRRTAGGSLFARWDDNGFAGIVDASGTWTEERARGVVSLKLAGSVVASIREETFDRTPQPSETREWLGRRLLWRAEGISVLGRNRMGRWFADYTSGHGWEGLRVDRNGALYARADAPIRSRDLTIEWDPAGVPLRLRTWSGAWSQKARGNVAMWPFDPLLGLVGTHRVAHAEASLAHRGFSIDRGGAADRFLDGGAALWRLEPRADYSSWRATFFGIGREDETSNESNVRAITLLGLRAALLVRAGGTRIRIEGIQWLPVRIEREGETGGGSGGSGGGGVFGPSDSGGSSTGGSVVRVSITSS